MDDETASIYIEKYVLVHLTILQEAIKESTFTPDIQHRFDLLNDYITL